MAGALALLLASSACTNSAPNAPANSTYGTGQPLAKPPSAGVSPKNAGPAGGQ